MARRNARGCRVVSLWIVELNNQEIWVDKGRLILDGYVAA
jgi:hypothetical protein